MATDTFWKLSSIISPFLSAGLAAWIGFRFARHGARADLFLKERVQAVQPLLSTLSVIRRYSHARKGIVDQRENASEVPDGAISILRLRDRLLGDIETADLFITDLERSALEPLLENMAMGAYAERSCSMDPSLEHSLVDMYETLSSTCSQVRDQMLLEIRKSYGS